MPPAVRQRMRLSASPCASGAWGSGASFGHCLRFCASLCHAALDRERRRSWSFTLVFDEKRLQNVFETVLASFVFLYASMNGLRSHSLKHMLAHVQNVLEFFMDGYNEIAF